jgi:hypothetical protein
MPAFESNRSTCLPGRAARQLPDQSTTLWVESSSTSDPRLRGALPKADMLGSHASAQSVLLAVGFAFYSD